MAQSGRIILAGGGDAKDSRPLDELFAFWVGPQGRVLYLPVALRGSRSFDTCLAWITGIFAPLNITSMTMWTDLTEHRSNELESFDAVYIGGGNTFSLLAELIDSGFDRYLRMYARGGGIVYGGSAGAVVLGKNIRTVSHMDRNDIGLAEVEGLNLADDHAIYPHYEPQNDRRIEEFVQTYRQPVLAIPERSGVVIDSGRMRAVGFEPSYRFDHHGKSTLFVPG
jgi:dipeptidase E